MKGSSGCGLRTIVGNHPGTVIPDSRKLASHKGAMRFFDDLPGSDRADCMDAGNRAHSGRGACLASTKWTLPNRVSRPGGMKLPRVFDHSKRPVPALLM